MSRRSALVHPHATKVRGENRSTCRRLGLFFLCVRIVEEGYDNDLRMSNHLPVWFFLFFFVMWRKRNEGASLVGRFSSSPAN
jgi:hypothetical protein